ncbi:HEAT repeat domain-containing protein [Sphingobacterium tabacisoli]|uniref:HEAT repeat domain-containing protein n=1 Tax=Sphingobacterium tabacisoli TaxID=2044855 RepID=A0ABW5L1J0_9SPHI|nr:HEAT repeat domain-containing protein [Sphingobacterium tabacisoli]
MLDLITLHELILAVIVVLIFVLILVISVLIFSFFRYKSLQHRQSWTTIIQQKITEVIVDGAERLPKDTSFALYLKIPSFRRYFLSTLVSSERKFTGKAREEVSRLFKVFNLEAEAWKKMRSKRDYLIAGGIQELTAMRVEQALPQISELLKYPQRQVYQEAQYAIVSFKGFEGLFFLDELQHPLSDWQQLRLLRSIEEVPDTHFEHINKWLGSRNESVVIFTLRLIGQFQLLTYYQEVLMLLDHDMVTVRKHAVRILQNLENQSTVNQLLTVFDNQCIEVQLEILKALKASKSKQTELFLQEQLRSHPDIGIKISAAEALMVLEGQSYLRAIVTSPETSSQIIQIVNHALQEKTC